MNTLIMLSAAALLGSTAQVQGQGMADIDTDGNGAISLNEAIAADATITASAFADYDTNADGELSGSEFGAWTAANARSATELGVQAGPAEADAEADAEAEAEAEAEADEDR